MSVLRFLKHWKIWGSLLGIVLALLVALLIGIMAQFTTTFSLFGGGDQAQSTSADGTTGVVYVKHWLGEDAYHSNFLGQRYGITADQIDGFIASEGYKNLGQRASGESFLDLQSASGIDVRVLVAFAQVESQFGEAVPSNQNMFGYGAFNDNPSNATNYADLASVKDFRSYQIDRLQNTSCFIDDERAEQFASGTLPTSSGVYWTGLDSGKSRAAIMQKLDDYIDQHDGTPDPPNGYGPAGGNSQTLGNGKGNLPLLDAQLGKVLGSGQCYALTSYYVNQLTAGRYSLGAGISGRFPPLGNGDTMDAYAIASAYNWSAIGWTVNLNPSYSDAKVGDIINFRGGPYSPVNGHTAVIGAILGNNQLVVYTQNPTPVNTQKITWTYVVSLVHPPSN